MYNNVLQKRTFRFVNNNDVVTRVPPRQPFGYAHVGSLRYFTEDGKLTTDLGFWYKFTDRIKGRVKDLLKPGTDGLKDHFMDGYVSLVRAAKK